MFSACRVIATHYSTSAQVLSALLCAAAFTACTKTEDAANTQAPITPALEASVDHTAHEVLKANFVAGGGPVAYEAHFKEGRLSRIDEQRGFSGAGVYEYQGARLLRYRGATLDATAAAMELELDLQGRITLARVGERTASEQEIREVRERSDLLRSHALAQRATRAHIKQTS